MNEGGFDVVIGNPPWAEYSTVKKGYTIKGYRTESAGNLYGLCAERSLALSRIGSYFSFIVQLPLVSASRMEPVRAALRTQSERIWLSTFDDRPGKLFEGLQNYRSATFIAQSGKGSIGTWSTRYHRWPSVTRSVLFATMRFTRESDSSDLGRIAAKRAGAIAAEILRKLVRFSARTIGGLRSPRPTAHFVFYQEATQYWAKATSALPYYAKNEVCSAPAHGRYIYYDSDAHAKGMTAVLNSSLFYLYFIAYGDCFHLSDTLASGFPLPPKLVDDAVLRKFSDKLMIELENHAERKTITSTRGGAIDRIEYDEYYGSRCKETIDQIDIRLAELYGFTAEETDYIINYDIKFRMGQDADAND